MDLNGLCARKNFWNKVNIHDSNGVPVYKTTGSTHFLFNKYTTIYKAPDFKTAWATIFHTSGRGMGTYIYEIHQQDKILAKAQVIRSNASFGPKDKVSIQDAEGNPLGFINYNEKLGGRSIVFSSFTIFDQTNQPIATIENKDRKAKVKLVMSETFEIVDAKKLSDKWTVIVTVILILKAAGLISH